MTKGTQRSTMFAVVDTKLGLYKKHMYPSEARKIVLKDPSRYILLTMKQFYDRDYINLNTYKEGDL